MKVLCSACLLGKNCKYNGGNNLNLKLKEYIKGKEVVAVCPEVLGGLPTPRTPAEIVDGVVRHANGHSVDKEFRLGAQKALDIALAEEVDLAILQARSPSCGVNMIYSGKFDGKLIKGEGVFAKLLKENGIKVISADELS